MIIGQVSGEIFSLHAPSRRAPSAALVVRRDGVADLIDLSAADPRLRVVRAWTPGRDRSPAATACWLNYSVPLLLARDGSLYALDRSKSDKAGLRVLGEDVHPGYAGRVDSLGLVGRQTYPSAGPPLAVTVDDRSACWWGFDEDFVPSVDEVLVWDDAEVQGRRSGPVLPWLTADGFVRTTDHGGYAAFRLARKTEGHATLQASDLGTATADTPAYRVGCAVPVLEDRRATALDVTVAAGSTLRVHRLRSDRPAEPTVSLSVGPEDEIVGADFRDGTGLVGVSTPTGGLVRLIDTGSGRLRWQFELEDRVQAVTLLTDSTGQLKAVAVDENGNVHAWSARPPSSDRVSTALTGGSTPEAEGRDYRTFRSITLD